MNQEKISELKAAVDRCKRTYDEAQSRYAKAMEQDQRVDSLKRLRRNLEKNPPLRVTVYSNCIQYVLDIQDEDALEKLLSLIDDSIALAEEIGEAYLNP